MSDALTRSDRGLPPRWQPDPGEDRLIASTDGVEVWIRYAPITIYGRGVLMLRTATEDIEVERHCALVLAEAVRVAAIVMGAGR